MTIEKGIFGSRPNFQDRYIHDHSRLNELVEYWKRMGLKIVLTQGTYDLIHDGHCEYLEKARSFGDLLIVGVDSDEKVRLRKGPNRPVVSEDERLRLLTYLRSVDVITLKNKEDERHHLLKLIKPDVLVVSESTSDRNFNDEAVNELKKYCGDVEVLSPQSVSSTTARVHQLMLIGSERLGKELAIELPALIEQVQQRIMEDKK